MKVKEMVVASLAALLAGCTCTTINDEYSVADPGKSGTLRYEKVADLDSRTTYSADTIPVVLRQNEGQEKKGAMGGAHGLVWLCTIGLFPAWDTFERTWEVEVKSPVGVKSGTCTRTRREYLGWIPYMLPFAASDAEQKSDPSGELVRRVTSQFKSEWTAEKVAQLNSAEKNRVAAQRKRAADLLSAKDWKGVVALCASEKDRRLAGEFTQKLRAAEKLTLAKLDESLAKLVAENEYEKAEKLHAAEYASWKEIKGHAEAAWKALSETVLKKKEQFRVESKRRNLEGLLAKGAFEEVIRECEKEGEAFADLAAKAKDAAQKEAQARLDGRKKEIGVLVSAGKYDEAIAACDKEISQTDGASLDRKLFWMNCKMDAARKGAEAKTAAIRKDLEARLQPMAKDRVAQILALAKKSAEESGNIDFYGFFVGMSEYDADALARHYGLEVVDEYSVVADEQAMANKIWISLKGIRRLAKKGNTFQELRRVVESRVGDMRIDTDSAADEAFDSALDVASDVTSEALKSSLTAVFSLGQVSPTLKKKKSLRLPKTKYVRETIDGVVARMFDGEEGGLVISQKNPKAREPIATEAAKVEYDAYSKISKITKPLDDLKREIKAEKERLEREAQAEKERRERMAVISEILKNMVSIPGKDFKMGKYEVTTKQWMAVMGHKKKDVVFLEGVRKPVVHVSYIGGDTKPVMHVSYNDCKEFLSVLNSIPEVQASGLTFRLPKEAEWEYACRAGSTGDYCKLADGTEITEKTLGEVAWYRDNSRVKTHPVGQKKPNAFGLYDMQGNVWEWCEDLYGADGSKRVCRGGSWCDDAIFCTASRRAGYYPNYRPDSFYSDLGFRLAASQDVNQ